MVGYWFSSVALDRIDANSAGVDREENEEDALATTLCTLRMCPADVVQSVRARVIENRLDCFQSDQQIRNHRPILNIEEVEAH